MDFPRFVHKDGGDTQIVQDAASHAAALADGWAALPVAMTVQKGDEQAVVYTAQQLQCALEQGWSRVEAVVAPPVALSPQPKPIVTPAAAISTPPKGRKK